MVFINTIEKMIAFAGGVTVGLMYKKYEHQLGNFMKKAGKKMD